MSIEIIKIPKEPQWEDIVIDANKDFNFFQIFRMNLVGSHIAACALISPLNANSYRIKNLAPPMMTGDGLSMGNPNPTVVGDAPFSFNDTVQSTNSTAMVKIKETRIWRPGAYRISFDIRSTQEGIRVWGIVLRNGSDVGAPLRETDSHTWSSFTHDIDGWSAGDFVQVFARAQSDMIHVEVRRLRLFIHESDFTEALM